jgi:hypothetical protein
MPARIKKNVLKAIQHAEVGMAKSLIMWKYRKNKIPVPEDTNLEKESQRVADKAHEIISKRGKNVWNEIKQIYENIKE